MRLRVRNVTAAAIAAVALASAPAFAANTPVTSVVVQPGEPVRIDMCSMVLAPSDVRLTAHVDVMNVSPKLVTDIELFFVTRDVFGESRITRGTVHGTYTTNIEIRNVYQAGLRARSAWYTDGYCTVSRVIYADGTKWTAGAGFLSSVVPSATGSPSALLSTLWPPGDE
ncbi:MAG TPA: hypothetical protein VHS78_03110 [Candidatus Elarobacter sp.]|jgi:hypothetical protein|nr:hypothetical protein [Candidatus Elarobacter sp.]